MPKYTTSFKALTPPYTGQLTSEIGSFKILCYIADFLFIVSWIIASVYNKAGIEGLDLDPEDDNKDPNTVSDTDAEKSGLTNKVAE